MRGVFKTRAIIQFALFIAVIAFASALITRQQNFASIAYPPIPDSHYQFIDDAARFCKVPLNRRGLIAAIAWKESTFRPASISSAGAVGVMQVLRGTGLGTANEYQIGGLNAATFTDPALGYKLGSCYFRSTLLSITDNDDTVWDNTRALKAALIGYNAGPGNGRSWYRSSATTASSYAERIIGAETVYNQDIIRHDFLLGTQSAIEPVSQQLRNLLWAFIGNKAATSTP